MGGVASDEAAGRVHAHRETGGSAEPRPQDLAEHQGGQPCHGRQPHRKRRMSQLLTVSPRGAPRALAARADRPVARALVAGVPPTTHWSRDFAQLASDRSCCARGRRRPGRGPKGPRPQASQADSVATASTAEASTVGAAQFRRIAAGSTSPRQNVSARREAPTQTHCRRVSPVPRTTVPATPVRGPENAPLRTPDSALGEVLPPGRRPSRTSASAASARMACETGGYPSRPFVIANSRDSVERLGPQRLRLL